MRLTQITDGKPREVLVRAASCRRYFLRHAARGVVDARPSAMGHYLVTLSTGIRLRVPVERADEDLLVLGSAETEEKE